MFAGSDNLFLGSNDGHVSIVGKNWKIIKKFQAHEAGAITQLQQVEGTSLLVTVAVRKLRPFLLLEKLELMNSRRK